MINKIRNKRLAKLSSQTSSHADTKKQEDSTDASMLDSAEKPTPQAPDKLEEQPKGSQPESSRSSGIKPMSLDNPNPAYAPSQPGLRGPRGKSPQMRLSSQTGRSITPVKRGSLGHREDSRSAAAEESLEIWENKTLSNIFRITLDPQETRDSHGHQLRYVAGVRADLEEQDTDITLNLTALDQAILEASSDLKESSPLDYLLECWKRVSRLYKTFRGVSLDDPKYQILKEARRLCISYCLFAVTMPDMFG